MIEWLEDEDEIGNFIPKEKYRYEFRYGDLVIIDNDYGDNKDTIYKIVGFENAWSDYVLLEVSVASDTYDSHWTLDDERICDMNEEPDELSLILKSARNKKVRWFNISEDYEECTFSLKLLEKAVKLGYWRIG